MAELAHVRAELAQLQSTERTLVEQLLAVRVAIETQKSKISKLVSDRPSSINRLPIELLTRILNFVIVSDHGVRYRFSRSSPTQREDLAGVSQFWRDLIRDTPIFWNNIELARDFDSKSLATQLKRSRGYLLDIVILNPHEGDLDALLDTLIPTTNRWRSLTVLAPETFLPKIIRKLNQYKFPCLEDVCIDLCRCSFPQFLLPENCPVLRRLDIIGLRMTRHFFSKASSTLTTLGLSMGSINDLSFLSRTPTQLLTSLTITGSVPDRNQDRVLGQNTFHFPVLQKLVLNTRSPHLFMDAIVAPKLEHFGYRHEPGAIFGTFGSKFSHVSYFTSLPEFYHGTFYSVVAHGLCQNFSGVRHASLSSTDVVAFFERIHPRGHLGPQAPADNWQSLEKLSIICTGEYNSCGVDALVRWLTKRQGLGLPSLHIQLDGSRSPSMTIEEFSLRYNQLRDCCALSFKDIEVSHILHPSMDGSLLHSCNGGQGQPHFAELAGNTS
ncbi:hypothetical protein EDD16DRAFT_376980 [Pisolithus croceorrhizus]|nr:hypothetical protein EDD16DRAFT_376980 [Pisolithus croceorrhizus]